MSSTYSRAKLEKYRNTLMNNLSVMEHNLMSLRSEEAFDGYASLFNQYKLLYNTILDFCQEFDLELPGFSHFLVPEETVTNEDLKEKMEITIKINELHNNRYFFTSKNLELNTDETLRTLLEVIDKDEFILQYNLNPSVSYNMAVRKASQKSISYILYALGMKSDAGRFLLPKLVIMEGFIGKRKHFWVKVKDMYYVDITLAQFTTKDIPPVSILPIHIGDSIYSIMDEHRWEEWIGMKWDTM
ncbi:hypothetical protein CN918_28325 [Priestia megaterium]|nr:hypothetical protein CN918_28325 [Priestia megaterium]